jgi:hypothetical protein
MNNLNEYQIFRTEFYRKKKNKNNIFPTYEKWDRARSQELVGSDISTQSIIDICNNITQTMGRRYLNDKNQQNKKLSTKERLRKKLLENKRKEVEEMLKRL